MIKDNELPKPVVGNHQGFKTYRKIALVYAKQMDDEFEVNTKEGRMFGERGDYLCYGSHGDKWPIKKEIFEATYIEHMGGMNES